MTERLIDNARLVLAGESFLGHLLLRDGRIAALGRGPAGARGAEDWGGDWLLPGLIEIHTDNLERHVMPRPKVVFPMLGAVQAHDAEIAAAGITTVFDAIGVGDPYDQGFRARSQAGALQALDRLQAVGALRADHWLHLRCELPAPNARELFEPFAASPRLRLLSLMDHTPGQRQWADLAHARVYYTGKKGWSDGRFDTEVALAPERQAAHARPNRAWFAEIARRQGLTLATHDDTTEAHVDEARALGATISEFPTTLAAARQARRCGLATVAGAPNVLRGGSHSGNVAALELAREGLLDMLSSDYVPTSLLQAAWRLRREAGFTPSEALALVSLNPARACGFAADRGQIAVGLRADLLRVVELEEGLPLVRETLVAGRRVC
ncbi:alpha-D-ribose 1-methylphosphonate 5-triphosphate diphosphatase [Roseateles sp. DAIF2]|uniref:alpha-D-ribose 1-methylphosphonate 5-triphosphate diphosphatase n=1 Tax=Roseateles sp. DAIF2 TaxID=2714952 RepID=UPI0018A303F3|nr:alpha-D-ribose 1-methylphosphonate 5-triphosphate diphosphatase [Roseateles sp. DAIF2]QPF71938.1 alpha-D-ribose 1-methylphosphonate 5-triphosphate diphosphatase [Roseateles sp. DAIF2]